ncbi:MAG TPA: multicopper oxidase family protein, partial [Gemmatimonadales bacterium]
MLSWLGTIAVAATLLWQSTPALAQRPCDDPTPDGPSKDLYCIELVPAPGIRNARGRVELAQPAGPFTVSLTRDGRPRYQLILSAEGLPAPGSLGARVLVAWVTSPSMESVQRMGVVRNGRTTLGTVELEKFVVLITAEPGAGVAEPGKRIVLRGQSPATRLFPPDLTLFSLGEMSPRGDSAKHSGQHHESMHHDAAPEETNLSWSTVPMPRALTMLPSETELRPATAPWLPSEHGPPVKPSQSIRLRDGDTLRIDADPVDSRLPGNPAALFAYNGQHPGPLIEVVQGSRITVLFRNSLSQPSSVHWHGIRLDNGNDGTPGLTQAAVPPGGEFTYHLRFPDAGIYWYHPHVREDTQQELGLYGNVLVHPKADGTEGKGYNRKVLLLLDDILANDSSLVPLGKDSPTHALMGRFGNIFLVNGERHYRLSVRRGEVIRFYLTNAAGARPLNLSFSGARMKLVGSDVGLYEREEWVESVVMAPAERYIVDVRFGRTGKVALVNRVRPLDHVYGRFFGETDTLGVVSVGPEAVGQDLRGSFDSLSRSASASELERYRRMALETPQKTLLLNLETRNLPFLTQRLMQLDSIYFAPVEWSGTMPMMNWASTGSQVRWVLRDAETGRENMDIDWRFQRGDPVRIRIVNQRQSIHAMQHPIHLHGQRFLILSVNGVPSRNLVWKDTVLVPAGGAVDILLDPSNPGRWM